MLAVGCVRMQAICVAGTVVLSPQPSAEVTLCQLSADVSAVNEPMDAVPDCIMRPEAMGSLG